MNQTCLTTMLDGGVARCGICQRRCAIAPGKAGYCRTRVNRDGHLVSLIANRISAACIDPIEKKPVYHWMPGTRVYSLGAIGCSFTCPGCQNGHIAHRDARQDTSLLSPCTAEEAVEAAVRLGAHGICWTYNDPAIWLEFTLGGVKLARQRGLYTVYVTNGTATREHLDAIGPYLDVYRVDIKAWSPDAYRALSGYADPAGIRDGVTYARTRWGMHIECVTNVTPTLNDHDEELHGIATWMAGTLGADTPWHVTRFHPSEGLAHLPATPLATLERAAEIGRQAGVRYVYLGNVAHDARQHTWCPRCHAVVIERAGFQARVVGLAHGACRACGTVIAGRFADAS